MSSETQIIANQNNAKLGGVKTEKGKAISRLNAMKHGILSTLVTPDEEKEIVGIYRTLIQKYVPLSPIEFVLMERLSLWIVRLRRAARAEKEILMAFKNPRRVEPAYSFEKVIDEGYTPKISANNILVLNNTYLRYESSLERNFYRTLHELERIQAVKNGDQSPPPITIDTLVEQYSNRKGE